MRVNVNNKPFDFDSDEPVVGEQFSKPIWPIVLEYAIVVDLILFGVWLCKWWYDGGFVVLLF